MLLGEPRPTNYDLHFDLFGIPVRIHPAFFLLPLLFTLRVGDVWITLIFTLIYFVSFLIHEMGHVLAYRYYGVPSRIILYMMGGLAQTDTSPWQVGTKSQLTPGQEIMMSFAGPFAGFVLAAVVALVVIAIGGDVGIEMYQLIPLVIADFSGTAIDDNYYLTTLVYYSILINFYLNLINLFPVFPLDGGKIARQFFIMHDAWNGLRNSLILSVVVGAVVAAYMLINQEFFIGVVFAVLAYGSYMSLQQYGSGGFGGRPW